MRLFLLTILLLAKFVLLPGPGHAEERLIAVILAKGAPRYQFIHEAFMSHLVDSGGHKVYVQTPNGDVLSLRNSARKAVAIGAELIVTYGASATRAALAESFDTPVIYADVYDPMVQGIIPDQYTPGRNATGIRGDAPIQTLLKNFKTMTGASHIVALYQAGDKAGENLVDSLQRIAANKNLQIFMLAKEASSTAAELLEKMPDETDGIYCVLSHHLTEDLTPLLDLATKEKIPVVSRIPGLAEQGALMVLETDPVEQGEKLAEYVNHLIQGSPLKELPPERPRNVSLIVNMKTANTLDIQVPFEILSVTSRLIR